MEMKAPTTTAHPQPPSGGVYPTGPPTAGGMLGVDEFQSAVQIQLSLCAAPAPSMCVSGGAAAVSRGPGPRLRIRRLPRSLLGAPTRADSHVAARQYFVGPGRLGGFITRRGRSMRTGGGVGLPGVGLPGRRPLPPIHTAKQPLSPPQALRRARPPSRSRALAPPPRHVTGGPARPARCALAPRRRQSPCSAVGLAPRPSEELAATYVRAGHRRRPHPRFLTEKREKPPRTDEACAQGPDSG